MHRLADVELQLVMHGLEARELLQFARCSRQLFHAADNPFAWLCSSLPVSPDRLSDPSLSAPSRLLRHAHISVRWNQRNPERERVRFLRLLAALSTLSLPLSELSYLDVCRSTGCLKAKQWMRLLSLPSVQSLTTLRAIGSPRVKLFDASTVRAICQLPKLHTLAVTECAGNAEVWAALSDAPALTSLHIVDRNMMDLEPEFSNSCLKYVRQCSKLTYLSVQSFALDCRGGFQAFFAGSPHHMQQLRSLHLHSLYCRNIPPAAFVAAFSSLTLLHSLTLCSWVHMNEVLPHLRWAAALRLLTFELDAGTILSNYLVSCQCTPAPKVLAQLLTDAPLLHATINLRGDELQGAKVGRRYLEAVELKSMSQQLTITTTILN